MMKPSLSRRVRVAIALSAAAGAIITLVVIASAGSAQDSPKMLRLVATAQQGIGFAPGREPRQGDRFGGGSKITGDSAGIQRTVCTVIGERGESAICTIELRLTRGTLSAQGLVPQRADDSPIAITGGTGAYDGAGGTAVDADQSDRDSLHDQAPSLRKPLRAETAADSAVTWSSGRSQCEIIAQPERLPSGNRFVVGYRGANDHGFNSVVVEAGSI
jgi:hypothetical protein